jgi:PASTA domain-containing protein
MPAFDVTANPTRLSLKPGASGTLVVTVTNRLGRSVTARADKVVTPPAAAAWVKAPADAQRVFSDQPTTQEFRFEVGIPANATPQSFTVRVDVVEVGAPDDNFGQSETIGVTVPAPDVKPVNGGKGIPVWVWPIVAVVVIGIGIGIWLATRGHGNKFPDLVKKSKADALKLVDTTRIFAIWVDTLNADTVAFKGGIVIAQKPPADSALKAVKPARDTLRIQVQRSFTLVPHVKGLDPSVAANNLGRDSLGLQLGSDCATVHSADDGKVVSSAPDEGALVARGTPVRINVRVFQTTCFIKINLLQDAAIMQKWKAAMERAKRP